MISRLLKDPKTKRLLIILALVVAAIVIAVVILNGQHYFNRRLIRNFDRYITSFGNWSPIAVILLFLVSTVVPPLPVPIPLVEIASGLAFGFWGGFVISWLCQIGASVLAFLLIRKLGRKSFNKLISGDRWKTYKSFIEQRGAKAIFITRAAMASPMNIVSFLAGLTDVDFKKFFVATAFGTIPEAALFSFIGTRLRSFNRLSLWYLFIVLILLGVVGWILTYIMTQSIKKNTSFKK